MSRDAALGTVFLSRTGASFLLLADDPVKHTITLFTGGVSLQIDRSQLAKLIASRQLEERAARIVPETAAQLAGAAS